MPKFAKFAFYYNDERKVEKVEYSLAVLYDANMLLTKDDYDYEKLPDKYGLSEDSEPFQLTYDVLCFRCYEKANKLFDLLEEDTWVEFMRLTDIDKKEGIHVAVRIFDLTEIPDEIKELVRVK